MSHCSCEKRKQAFSIIAFFDKELTMPPMNILNKVIWMTLEACSFIGEVSWQYKTKKEHQ